MAQRGRTTTAEAGSTNSRVAGSAEAVAALIDSPCLSRGAEMIVDVQARVGDEIELRFQLCSSPALFVVHFQRSSITAPPAQPIVDQPIVSSQPVFVSLGPLEAGSYTLTWQFSPGADSWQSVAEVNVNDVVRFRRYRSTENRIPLNLGFARIEVRP